MPGWQYSSEYQGPPPLSLLNCIGIQRYQQDLLVDGAGPRRACMRCTIFLSDKRLMWCAYYGVITFTTPETRS